jgi:hypothetical protein
MTMTRHRSVHLRVVPRRLAAAAPVASRKPRRDCISDLSDRNPYPSKIHLFGAGDTSRGAGGSA